MRKLLVLEIALLFVLAPIYAAQGLGGKGGMGGKAGFGGGVGSSGGAISLRHPSVSIDSGTVGATPILDYGFAIPAGDLVVLSITTGQGANPNNVCDSTTNTTCSSAASTWTIGSPFTNSTSSTSTTFAYTCNAAASTRYFTVGFDSGANDETVTIFDVIHTVTSGCQDASASGPTSGTAGATVTTGTYTTAIANEISIAGMGDDNNSGPGWSGQSAGSGFTLGGLGVGYSNPNASMLGAAEYKIHSTIQTGVTASLNTGNSSGDAVSFGVMTFE